MATKYVLFLNPLWKQSAPWLIKIGAAGVSLKTFVPRVKGTNEKFMVSETWRRKREWKKFCPATLENIWSHAIDQGNLNLHLKSFAYLITIPTITA